MYRQSVQAVMIRKSEIICLIIRRLQIFYILMTDRYAVVGNPISHSKSPLIHAEFARQTGQDMTYAALLAPLEDFAGTARQFQTEGGKGLNVTVPFKLEAWNIVNLLTRRATDAHAVNTLQFLEDGSILGDNTDGFGLVRDITHNLNFELNGKKILLMGAGGAAYGVLHPLLDQHPTALVIVNRTLDKATAIQKKVEESGKHSLTSVTACSYTDVGEHQFDVVINATSSSLHGELPPLPPSIFAPGALAYDMMYGKGLTPFLQFAQANGAAHLADGLGMLVEQAAESFLLWRGIRPQTQSVITLLKPC